MWRSDGTITETVLITDNHSVFDFYPTNDSIYIVERTLNPTIYSLWKFDKTNSGFKELVTGFSSMSQLFTIEDTLYFKGDDGTHGDELWRSDGTIAGTVLAADIANGSDGSNVGLNFEFSTMPWKAQKIGNTLYFRADDKVHDAELWAYDLGTNLASYEVAGSTCTISPTLPSGLNFDTGTCTISGTPSVVTSNTTYTVTANISGTDYQATIWLSSAYRQLTPSAEGADLMVGNVMGDITFQYNGQTSSNLLIQNPAWTADDIATSAESATSVHVADMDGDGDLDIVSASYADNTIAWYENDGAADPSWTAADIASSADGATEVYVADMDNDGDLDIVSASWNDDTIAWYENDGAADPSWTAADIAASADDAYHIHVADMDNDGDLDIVSASINDDTIAWYENDGAADPSWTAADIATSADGAFGVHVADMDGDGDLDIVSASGYDDTIAWYENDGAADPSWTAADIATSAEGARSVYVADMDGDGDLDIVSASFNDDTIAWYENDGAADPSWTAADIATSADGAHCVYVADMDGDGDLDIVSASFYDDTIAWYENDGAADPSWTAADIATSADGAEEVYVADMDGDGDLDIVSASWNDDTIAWYEQTATGTWSNTTGMTNLTSATCSVSPSLPTGLSIDSSTCTISGTPSVATSNTTYTVTANISGTTYQGTVWLATIGFATITSSVMGAELELGEAMTPIALNYTPTVPQNAVSTGNNTTWYLTPTSGSETTVIQCKQPKLRDMGDYYISECQDDVSILDLNNGTRTTIFANVYAYDNPKMQWSVEMDGSIYYMLENASMYKYDEANRSIVHVITNSFSDQYPRYTYTQPNPDLQVLNGEFFWKAQTSGQWQIWKSDGTAAGTVPVVNLRRRSSSTDPLPTLYNGELYFMNYDSTSGVGLGLYATDGTTSGTRLVTNNSSLRPTGSWFGDEGTAIFNNELYYFNGGSLVKTDGTTNGTTVVTQCDWAGGERELFIHNQNLYWAGVCLGNTNMGNELYKYDGTNVSLVSNFVPDSSSSSTYSNGVINAPQYMKFKAWNETHFAFKGAISSAGNWNSYNDDYLYITDGTANGTIVVVDGDIFVDAYGSGEKPSMIGSILYHSKDSSHGIDWCYTDFSGIRMNPVNGSSVSETCFNVNSGQYQTNHGYMASFNINDTLIILMWSANPNYGNYGDGMQYYSYAPHNITLTTPVPVAWDIHPELPEGMSLVNGVISGTPTVYALNQTYTVYANQSGQTTTFGMYFSVGTNNPHTVVENQPIDAIGFQDPFQNGTTNWTVSPALPADLVMDPNTGEITGSVNGVLANTTYTVTATHGSSGSGGSGSGSGNSYVNNSGVVSNFSSAGEHACILVDSNDNLHISHHGGLAGDDSLLYSTDASGTWNTIILDSLNNPGVGNVGRHSSMAIAF